jgi:peptidoglycan/LPS O-acetylase OafA/YrhL
MTPLFVSYTGQNNQINEQYALYSLVAVSFILLIITLTSIKKKNPVIGITGNDESYFTMDSTRTLRGIAIIFLIFGHFSIKCVEGVLPTEYAGEYAVIIFLLLSGIGLTKAYGISRLDGTFLSKRIKRLFIPLWITLILFYSLDYLLLNRTHPVSKFILSVIGIINQDPPNGPDWFISYILFLYFVYYIVSKFKTYPFFRFLSILIISYFTAALIMEFRQLAYFRMWNKYPVVFPCAVGCGIYREKIYKILTSIFKASPFVYFLCMILSLLFFLNNTGIESILIIIKNSMVSELISTLRPIYFISFLFMFIFLIEKINYNSRFLLFLGDYSFEIYLLHMPFMVYYDFFLFRKPLMVYFYVYGTFIIGISYLLNRTSENINRSLMKKFYSMAT